MSIALSLPSITSTANSTANSAEHVLRFGDSPAFYLHVETRAELCFRRSNECADAAVAYGCRGSVATAELCAQMADLFDLLAMFYAMLDRADFDPGPFHHGEVSGSSRGGGR